MGDKKRNSTNISNELVEPVINTSIKKTTFFKRIVEKIGVHWNFGKYNKNKLLSAINTPLKYIEISERRYNGDYGKGSIFENVNKFYFYGKNAIISSAIDFCLDESIRDKAKIEVSVPFAMDEENIIKLDEILKKIISNNNYKYAENHYSNDIFDFKKFSYTDVTVDGISYELLIDDEILCDLKTMIKCELSDSIVLEGYKKLVD